MSGRRLVAASVAHGHADVETIERARFDSQTSGVTTLLDRVRCEEALVLQTCHRTEAYVVTDGDHRSLAETLFPAIPRPSVRTMGHDAAIEHLCRVAAGLESVVTGEEQILGQVGDAYEAARAADGVGRVLETVVPSAMRVGERARTETAINDGVVSLGGAAVRLADRELDLHGQRAVVVGAGEMGRTVARSLADRTAVERVTVANRTVETATRVASDLACAADAVGLDAIERASVDARLVVTATAAADPVLDRSTLESAGETVVIDLGQPRDVAAAARDLPHVESYDLGDVEAITDAAQAERGAATAAVEQLIDDACARLDRRLERRRADAAISAMYEAGERIKADQIEQASQRIDAGGDERAVLEDMADAIVNRLLATPTEALRDAAEDGDLETLEVALDVFDPETSTADHTSERAPDPEPAPRARGRGED
ncbi:glutamyl-tRNA reductase [Halococcoides cellulosivorans]|uniref:Glutamyl-tRNA reductase n=1 Tax=Halococcoides cellulosivorans TaxID=1679096 RepID=A0A2R4X0K7_9EURY|nr:glutamyl-tRNA reductase [Halococcoides cellulosivorans]AWB27293.1 glutamyl-tRNA reductase [Halococcoides cellulosivorans]